MRRRAAAAAVARGKQLMRRLGAGCKPLGRRRRWGGRSRGGRGRWWRGGGEEGGAEEAQGAGEVTRARSCGAGVRATSFQHAAGIRAAV